MRIMIYSIFACLLGLARADGLFDNKMYHDVLDPGLCARQMELIDKSVYYDSSFQVPNGILGGNFIHLGNYYQCLAINQEFPGSNVEGKYCIIDAKSTSPTLKIPSLGDISQSNNVTWSAWKFNWSKDDIFKYHSYAVNIETSSESTNASELQSVTLSLGVCVPKPCTVDSLLRPYAEHPLINFTYTEKFCRLPGDKTVTGVDYLLFGIYSFIGLLTVISTAYELSYLFILKKDPSGASELLRVCSLYSNTTRLMTFAESPQALHCLDGIRTLSVLRIILQHSYFILNTYSTNRLEFAQWSYELNYLWVFSSSTSVDTFFVLSGMLLVYSTTFKMTQESLLRNLHLFYMKRYVRLFPLLAGMVLLQASLFHHVADGPYWYYISSQVVQCRKLWWATLLHVQNLINTTALCVGPTWYLSVDMQLHLVSPLVLYWTLGYARAAWTALTAAVLASLAGTLVVCFFFNFNTSWWRANCGDYAVWYYKNPITRSPPFFIGMLFGYVLNILRDKKINLPKWYVFLGHSLALVLSFYAFYIVHPTMQPDWDNQPALNVHNALFRSCWALALCWLIFACVHGYGGPVNWFLSLKLWRFPARISYAMYLYHRPVQYVFEGAIVETCYFSILTLLTKFFADVVYTVMLSIVACVVIEEPVLTLLKLQRKLKQSKKTLNKESC